MLLASGPKFLVVVPRTLVVIAALGIWALPAPVASATTFEALVQCCWQIMSKQHATYQENVVLAKKS